MRANQQIPDLPVSELMYVADEGDTPTSGHSVLVATSFDAASDVALRRGEVLAKTFDAKLVVLHVVPPESWVNMLFPQKHAMDAIAMQRLLIAAVEATRTWCRDVLGPDAAQPAIMLKRGRVAPAILEAATDLRAALIVLGDSPGSSAGLLGGGGVATAVIHRSRRPVLVARPERANKEIVAATNFADANYPALRQAARLGVRLRAPVTFVHNVDASDYVAAATFFGMAMPATVVPRESDLERRQHELEEIARFMGNDIESVVVMKGRPVDAILDVARKRDADLVVVGARRRRGVTDRAFRGTAAGVAQAALRSVLIVPLRGREPSGWTSRSTANER